MHDDCSLQLTNFQLISNLDLFPEIHVRDKCGIDKKSTLAKDQLSNYRPISNLSPKRCVALTWRNTTGPPCSRGAIIRLEAAWRHRLACAGEPPAGPPLSVTDPDRRRQQTTDASEQNNTGPFGGPVTIKRIFNSRLIDHLTSNKLLYPQSLST